MTESPTQRRIQSQEDQEDLVTRLGASGPEPGCQRISLYVPVDRAPTELHASELRLRAGVDRAAERLSERGVAPEAVAARIDALPDLAGLLRTLGAGVRTLAAFGDDRPGDEGAWTWAPLLEAAPERVVVGEAFALRPLIRALRHDCRFRVLAVSANRVAAYEGDAGGIRPVVVPDLPASLEDALGHDVEGRGLAFRSDHPVPGQRGNAPIYHGHGGADEGREVDRERFHRVIGSAVTAAWGADDVPTVLAAEVRGAGELRKSAHLPGLLDAEISGNPDDASPEELHARAWPLIRSALDAREARLAEGFERARNSGKALERELHAVAQAAIAGRVRRLWIEQEAHAPGRIDPTSGRHVEAADGGDEDALDALVAHVLARGGEVIVVDEGHTPAGGAYCAELR